MTQAVPRELRSGLYLRRRVANGVFIVLSLAAAVFGLLWLAMILVTLLGNGVAALGPHRGARARTCSARLILA